MTSNAAWEATDGGMKQVDLWAAQLKEDNNKELTWTNTGVRKC